MKITIQLEAGGTEQVEAVRVEGTPFAVHTVLLESDQEFFMFAATHIPTGARIPCEWDTCLAAIRGVRRWWAMFSDEDKAVVSREPPDMKALAGVVGKYNDLLLLEDAYVRMKLEDELEAST